MKNLQLNTGLIILLLILMGFGGVFSHSLFAMDLSKDSEVKKYHPKLESVLGRLAEEYSQDKTAMQKFAGQRSIPLENDEVRVILVPPPGEDTSVIDQLVLVSYGVTIEAISRHLMRARIPIFLLEKIADKVEGISYIRLPYQPSSDMRSEESIKASNSSRVSQVYPQQASLGVISEGVELTGASTYHDSGYNGQNTKVAVIDIGFANLTNSQNHSELPSDVITKDFTGTGIQAGRNHGTGVAEIVYDMAPEAQFYLIKIGDEVDLENAKDYCIDEGVDIVNHSWIWFNTNFTDGTGLICDIANDARSSGILWVNAAGNSAKDHYQGLFTDTDGDGWHEFSSGDDTNDIEHHGGSYELYLTWDCWPTTDQDYDLYLYNSALSLVAFSTNRQTGSQAPAESIILSDLSAGTYHIMIEEYSATENQELKLFTDILEYQTAQYSVGSPADATGTMAVGYVNIANWETGPQGSYSSQGPTNDGRVKPDIMGPAGVDSFTWGIGNFTSAATPHVSGAASLVLSRYPSSTAGQLQSTLEGWAVDMGALGKDNIYGYGRLKLPPPPPPPSPPLLSWTGEANYETDGLNPEKGKVSTSFVYRVEYTDENNYAPENSYPKVHILKDGFEIADSPFTMNEVDSGDTTYTNGKLYTHTKTGLALGENYSYYFEAYDAHNQMAAKGDPTSERDGPLVAVPPLLSWTGEANYESDGLDPEMGDTTTEFVYRVQYVDGSNYAPENGYPKVHILKNGSEIAGSPFSMSEVDSGDTTYTNGKLYTYTKTGLALGEDYSYYFEAYDAHNQMAAEGDPTSEREGPWVAFPPLLSWTGEANYESDGLDPEMGDSATDFIYRVEYFSEYNYAPENNYPKVHILKDGFEIAGSPFSMSGVDSGDTTYTNGKLYTYTKIGLTGGEDYSYYFEAYDAHNQMAAEGDPTSEREGPWVAFPPLLSWTGEANYESDGLDPEMGDSATDFIYRVEYFSEYNYAPENNYPKVHILKDGFEIAGSPFTIKEADPGDTIYTDGKIYTYAKTGLSAGLDYIYYFEAYDSYYELLAVGEPTSERIGPTMVLSDNLKDLIVYPNPFSLLEGHNQINFSGLTSDAKIRVFTLTGRLLKEEEVNWQHSWTWDVRNMEGEEVARGIYLWVVTNSTGKRKIGKISIIR